MKTLGDRARKWSVSLLVCAALSAQADEVSDTMTSSLEAYQAGDYTLAMDDLKYVQGLIQKKINAQSATLMPDALPGLDAGKIGNVSAAMAMFGVGSGTQLERAYQNGKKRVQIMIASNSPMLAAMGMMVGNPAMMASDGYEPFRYQRIKGMKRDQDNEREVTLMLSQQILVSVKGDRDSSMDDVMAYLKALDLDKIKQQLTQA